jgi:hypothetical protein
MPVSTARAAGLETPPRCCSYLVMLMSWALSVSPASTVMVACACEWHAFVVRVHCAGKTYDRVAVDLCAGMPALLVAVVHAMQA